MQKGNNHKALGYAIARTNWHMKNLLSKLMQEEETGITYEQWIVLKVIHENPAMSQTEVAVMSQKDKANITRMIDVLETNGFIERRKDAQDRRMYRMHSTQEGRKALEKIGPITQKTDEICTRNLGDAQVAQMIELLDKVCDNVKKEM